MHFSSSSALAPILVHSEVAVRFALKAGAGGADFRAGGIDFDAGGVGVTAGGVGAGGVGVTRGVGIEGGVGGAGGADLRAAAFFGAEAEADAVRILNLREAAAEVTDLSSAGSPIILEKSNTKPP